VFHNSLIGQNGFLTTSIFIIGVSLLQKRPLLAGAILGTLIIKPHLALLLPVAVVAARLWSAAAGAALTILALLLLSLLLFGWQAYAGFLALLPQFTGGMDRNAWPWDEFASLFALGRYFGLAPWVAMTIHAIVAAAAAALTWQAWSRQWEQRIAVLATATLLVPPYLLTYDALLLVVPLGLWMTQGRRPVTIAVVWLLCALPVAQFFKLYEGPNTVPFATLVALAALLPRRNTAQDSGRSQLPA
jgi:hypothetical protein